jgi:hypothetical protein
MNNPKDVNRTLAGQTQKPARSSRFLLWVVIGLFVLALLGGVAGVYVFRNVLRPGQQQRIIDMAPFMSAFLSRPDPNATLPTVSAPTSEGGLSPEDLLAAPLILSTEEVTGLTESQATPTPEATEVSALPRPAAPHGISLVSYTRPILQAEAQPAPQQSDSQSLLPSVPSDHRLYGIRHIQQTWNNCGPANVTMALSFFGWQSGQEEAASFLKPDSEDKNVSPSEMVAFVNENSGVRAISRIGGNMELLKALVANEFPVIIESGYAPEGYDWIGHYRTVVGYDDNLQVFYIYDSYLGSGENGAGMAIPYAEFDRDWQNFNRVFIVLYLPEREGELVSIIGDLADVTRAAEIAYEEARQEARANPQNVYAWFNMGTALTRLGRYDEAAVAYDQATRVGLHYRMTWYQFGIFEAYFNVGRYDDVMSYVDSNLTSGGEYVEETHYWQGRVYAAEGRNDLARASFTRALQHNPRYQAAQDALNALGA